MHPPATTPRFDLAVAPSTVRPPMAQGPGGNGKHGKDAPRAPRARQATRCRARAAVGSGQPQAAAGTARTTDRRREPVIKHGAAAMDARWMDGHVRADADAAVLSVPLWLCLIRLRPKLGTRGRPLPRSRSLARVRHVSPIDSPSLHTGTGKTQTNHAGPRRLFFWSRLLYAHKYGFLLIFFVPDFFSVVSLSAGSSGLASSAVAYTYTFVQCHY